MLYLELIFRKPEKLLSSFAELNFSNGKNIICSTSYLNPGMKISYFSNEYLAILISIFQIPRGTPKY